MFYLKVTNENECHYGYQYHDGLNILVDEFNSDPNSACCKGGFYFTTTENIHLFYNYGCNIRMVYLPSADPNLQVVKDPSSDKYRANRIILGKRYSMSDPQTYIDLGIEFPKVCFVAGRGYLEVLRYMVEKLNISLADIYNDVYYNMLDPLSIAAANGHTNVVAFLIEIGFNVHIWDDRPLFLAVNGKHNDTIKLLVQNGANVHIHDEYPLGYSINFGTVEMVKLLIENGATLQEHHIDGISFPYRFGIKKEILAYLDPIVKKLNK